MLRRIALLAALLLAPRAAAAQLTEPLGPTKQPTVVPPALKTDSPATYPEQALRDKVKTRVVVRLVLEIDANGAVTNATTQAAAGHGFDESAIEAAKKLVFTPATKDGKPIASKITFDYAFDPPPARIAGRVARRATDSPIAGATVVVTDAKGAEHRATTAPDGTFRIDNIPHGRVHVKVEAKNQKPDELDEDLSPGEETGIIVRLVPVEDAAPPPVGPDGEPVDEVTVRAVRPPREITKRSIPRDEIAVIPGTNGDALRSIQNLPGVARPPPFAGQLIVRGSAPEDSGYYIDGTFVPLIYHFGGLSSVVPTDIIDRIDFYPGNFGVPFGRAMGGIIDVGLRGPKTDDSTVHGMAQADLIDLRLLVEKNLGKGWSVLAAGRRSWFDVWLGPILEGAGGVSTAPRYYDYQLMVQKEFGPEHTLRFLFLGSDDRISIFGADGGGDFALGGGIRATIAFWRAQARYVNKLSKDTRLTGVFAVGSDTIDFGFGENYFTIDTFPISGRLELSHRLAKAVTTNVGVDIIDTPYDVTVRFPRPGRPGVPTGGLGEPSLTTKVSGAVYTPAAYADAEVTPFTGTRIIPGVRVDYLKTTKAWDVSPRVVARQDLTKSGWRSTVKGGIGAYYQPPDPAQLDETFGQPGLKTQRAVHYSLGFEQELGDHLQLSVEGFYKNFDRLVVQNNGNAGDGHAYGTEWLMRWQKDPKLFGWVAYTLSRSERRDDPNEPLRRFQYDQTHILTVLGSRVLPKGFRVGARFRLVSGNLYTQSNPGVFDADRNSYLAVNSFPPFGARLGMFHQLDFRIDKTIDAKPLKLTAYLDIQNVYFHRSEEGVSYSYDYRFSNPVLGLPILPILGMRGEW